MPARSTLLCFLFAAALLPAACADLRSPAGQPAADAAPDTAEVMFLTDPATGRTDGPFDPATGLRVTTREDDRGTLRVVLDPISIQPILLPEPPAAALAEKPAAPTGPIPLTGPAAAPKPKTTPPPVPVPSVPTTAAPVSGQPQVAPSPLLPPTVSLPPPVVQPVAVEPETLPPPAAKSPPPTPSGAVAAGITPVRYHAPLPGSGMLTATVPRPEQPPISASPVSPPPVPALPVPAPPAPPPPAVPAAAPVPAPKPGSRPVTVQNGMVSTTTKGGYTAVVPITAFGSVAPPAAPAPAPAAPVVSTARMPTMILPTPDR